MGKQQQQQQQQKTQNQAKVCTKKKYSSLKMKNKVIFQIYKSWKNLTLAESY